MSTSIEARNYGVATAQAQGGAMATNQSSALSVPPAPQPPELVVAAPPAELALVVEPPPTPPAPTPPAPTLSPPVPDPTPVPSMNIWSFLHYQCLRLPPRTVALLIFAGLVGLGVVVCFAGKSAIAATVVGGVTGFVKKLASKVTGGA